VLDSSKQNTIALNRDLETLQLYIDLEKFRTENRFSANINVDKELLEDDYRVPPLIIQPYVENAILHGLRNLPDDRGILKIDVSKQENQLIYIIEDNGIGRDRQKKTSYQGNGSYGMEMTLERVKLYNGEENASVEITDLFSNGVPAGTKVKVALKIK
jgi:LytS/YehU family sensor histidine kinase